MACPTLDLFNCTQDLQGWEAQQTFVSVVFSCSKSSCIGERNQHKQRHVINDRFAGYVACKIQSRLLLRLSEESQEKGITYPETRRRLEEEG